MWRLLLCVETEMKTVRVSMRMRVCVMCHACTGGAPRDASLIGPLHEVGDQLKRTATRVTSGAKLRLHDSCLRTSECVSRQHSGRISTWHDVVVAPAQWRKRMNDCRARAA